VGTHTNMVWELTQMMNGVYARKSDWCMPTYIMYICYVLVIEIISGSGTGYGLSVGKISKVLQGWKREHMQW
jgi:hypothetical protein